MGRKTLYRTHTHTEWANELRARKNRARPLGKSRQNFPDSNGRHTIGWLGGKLDYYINFHFESWKIQHTVSTKVMDYFFFGLCVSSRCAWDLRGKTDFNFRWKMGLRNGFAGRTLGRSGLFKASSGSRRLSM